MLILWLPCIFFLKEYTVNKDKRNSISTFTSKSGEEAVLATKSPFSSNEKPVAFWMRKPLDAGRQPISTCQTGFSCSTQQEFLKEIKFSYFIIIQMH